MHELALFAGAGGGILAGRLLGWRTIAACEIEPYPRAVLLHNQKLGNLPHFPIWDDICTFDGTPFRGHIDIVTGGFPCQDISAQQAKVQASPAPAPVYGLKCTESFAKYDPATHSWKTPQCSLLEDLDEFSETFPKSGIMLHGVCWELPTAVPPTAETASGFSLGMLPTPIAHNAQETGCPSDQRRKSPGLGTMAATGQLGTPGALNPEWVEWLMGWPLGWTDLKHSATARFRSWLRQHSKSLNRP